MTEHPPVTLTVGNRRVAVHALRACASSAYGHVNRFKAAQRPLSLHAQLRAQHFGGGVAQRTG